MGNVAELDKTGQLLVADSPVGAVLVVGTSKVAKDLIVVNSTCTHKGCTVAWRTNKNSLYVLVMMQNLLVMAKYKKAQPKNH